MTAPHAALVSAEGRWRRASAGWAIALAAVLVLLGAAVAQRALVLSDELILAGVQRLASPGLDAVMSALSVLGSSELTFAVLLGVVLLWRRAGVPWWQRLIPVVVLMALVGVELLLKATLQQPGPEPFLRRGVEVGVGLPTTYAFPSGHALRATFVIGVVALRLAARGRALPWLLGAMLLTWLVAFSRVYLGDHWASDVAGGILMGGIGLGLCLAYVPRAVLAGAFPPTPARSIPPP